MSIYESIGGAPAVALAVDGFYERVTEDPLVAPYFEGIDMNQLKAHQRAFIAAAVGGPDVYTGRSMAEAHASLAITPETFARVVDHLAATLQSLGVDQDTISDITAALAPLEEEIVTAS